MPDNKADAILALLAQTSREEPDAATDAYWMMGNREGYQRGYREGFLACREAAAKAARESWASARAQGPKIAERIEALTPGER